ncbi:hypothetical protein QE152_g13209 [Popillia japonica]|uniref:Uncharacterized protein n=1 Tax=Popillia japonica TaxID=7064 RepID=A0AAW1LF79_POPJA
MWEEICAEESPDHSEEELALDADIVENKTQIASLSRTAKLRMMKKMHQLRKFQDFHVSLEEIILQIGGNMSRKELRELDKKILLSVSLA